LDEVYDKFVMLGDSSFLVCMGVTGIITDGAVRGSDAGKIRKADRHFAEWVASTSVQCHDTGRSQL